MSITQDKTAIRLCKNPYPYKAMLAICSDLDETASCDVYFETLRYLNSTNSGRFGRGVGLEVGNTMYFDMPPGEFSYWNASDSEQGRIRELIRAGLIDCFHSFGDAAAERKNAGRVLEHLDRHACHLKVWVDHATAPTNFGRDIMMGQGDVVGSEAYHADLTLAYGVKYLWMGRVTSMQGQDTPVGIGGVIKLSDPYYSSKTACTELAKIALGALGSRKYRMHCRNRLIRKVELRDGQKTTEFLRANPNPRGVSVGDTASGLADALDARVLDKLLSREARAIFYTHLGKEIESQTGPPKRTRDALERLADHYSKGEILVTTTRRLLDYAFMHSAISWSVHERGGVTLIDIESSDSDVCLSGLSFEVSADERYAVNFNGRAVKTNTVESAVPNLSIANVPWHQLTHV